MDLQKTSNQTYDNKEPFRTLISVKALEVYEYSIFIDADLTGIVELNLWDETNSFAYTSKEIIPSPSGSVIYFNEPVSKNIISQCLYQAYISNRTTSYWLAMEISAGVTICDPARTLMILPVFNYF